MEHYDYVLQPNGFKKKIFGIKDIEDVLDTWREYIENNWISPQNKKNSLFDPESKVKYMLEGLANILLRNHMDGILTEYKKMKIGKYEFPFSSCASLFADEIYSEFLKNDNGEEERKLNDLMAEMARRYDEAKSAKTRNKPRPAKTFPSTRRQKIERIRKENDVKMFEFVRVDTNNEFEWRGTYYRIPDYISVYRPKQTKDEDLIYDMDQILCAETEFGKVLFFDMNIEPVEGITIVGEQLSWCENKFMKP